MRILMAASEGVPYSKTGGLADVLGGLPRALAAMGHEVAVILPRWGVTRLEKSEVPIPSLSVPMGAGTRFASIIESPVRDGVRHFFVEYPQFFDRDHLYGDGDDAERFCFFSRAVLETAKHVFLPDILHCHDWQTALVPVLKKTAYSFDWAFGRIPVVLTIHNLGYQGNFPKEIMPYLGLGWDLFTMHRLEFYDRVNFLKGGIVYADRVTTVSPKYAQEIQTGDFGFGLDAVIRSRGSAVSGILNGVDYAAWNPETDRFVAAHYSAADLAGKRACKQALLEAFPHMTQDLDRPLIGIVSRFTYQKGFDLLAHVASELAREHLGLVVLGSGDQHDIDLFDWLTRTIPEKFGVYVGYDNELAHKIEAGADMFLMPSRYEPCGLNQIYSLKYGTVPVVRATGGLDDTIDAETGFKFANFDGTGLMWAVREALAAYANRERWEAMMRAGMSRDFSWDASAGEYNRLYNELHR